VTGRNWKDVLTEVLTGYKFWIGLGVAGVIVADAVGVVDLPTVRLTKQMKVLLVGLTGGALLGYLPSAKIVEWLYSPNWVYLLEVDARTDDFALWKLSPEQFDDLDVLHGELHRLSATAEVWEAQAYVPDRNSAIGTWRGSASNMELLEERERIDELRETLEAEAQQGMSIRIKVGAIVRSAVNDIVHDIVGQYEGITIHRGEQVENSVQEALEDYDLLSREEDEREDDLNESEGGERWDDAETVVAADADTQVSADD
jgi:hypothetical protein